MKIKNFLIIVFLFLVFTKVDYRLNEIFPGGSQDDSIYYYHVQTIVEDRDFDYTNQLNGNLKDAYIKSDGNPVPRQSFGSAILASPFVALSNFITNIFDINTYTSLNYFIYSITPIIFLIFSFRIIISLTPNFKNKNIFTFIIFLGSGITYYAFERFSMSTVYEFFSFCLIMKFTDFIYKKEKLNTNYLFFLPILQFIFLMIRWNNYHIFLLPIVYVYFVLKSNFSIGRNKKFIVGNVAGILLFLGHTKLIYGVTTFLQSTIYPQDGWVVYQRLEDYRNLNLFWGNIQELIQNFLVILFSQEFGLLYFCPVVFLSFYYFWRTLSQKKYFQGLILFIYYIFPLIPVMLFESHGGSYGFRYLYTLIPLNIIFLYQDRKDKKHIFNAVILFSIFGSLSQLFFESTSFSTLSEGKIFNSFDSLVPYANPNYLLGVLKSFIAIEAYQKIIFTSFVGLLSVKIIALFTNPSEVLLTYFSLDSKTIEYINNYENYSWSFVFLLTLIYVYFSYLIIEKSKK